MIGLLDPRLGGLLASLTWVHCVHSVLRGNIHSSPLHLQPLSSEKCWSVDFYQKFIFWGMSHTPSGSFKIWDKLWWVAPQGS